MDPQNHIKTQNPHRDEDRRPQDEEKHERKDVPTIKQRSPLDGLLEDPKPEDKGVASLDKAVWDPTRAKSTPERAAEEP